MTKSRNKLALQLQWFYIIFLANLFPKNFMVNSTTAGSQTDQGETRKVLKQFIDYYYRFLGENSSQNGRENIVDSFYLDQQTQLVINGHDFHGQSDTKRALSQLIPE